MSNLFEEALADAKKLKEVAEENAKKAILESVTPKIREFIEEQLLENDDIVRDSDGMITGGNETFVSNHFDHDLSDEEITQQLDESTINDLLKMVGGNKIYESLSKNAKNKVMNIAIQKTFNSLNQKDQKNILNISNKINENLDNLGTSNINNTVDAYQENNSMSRREKYYEVDLKMLREAVEAETEALNIADKLEDADEGHHVYEDSQEEMHSLDELDEYSLEEDDDLEKMMENITATISGIDGDEADLAKFDNASIDFDFEGEEDSEEESEDSEEESEDLAALEDSEEESEEEDMMADMAPPSELAEAFEVDPDMLREELANIRRQLKEGKMDHHFGGKGGSKAGVKGAFGGNGPKKAGYQKSFGGGSYGQDPFTNPPQINKLNEAIRKLRRMNRAQDEKLNKYRSAVQTLREQLEDLNLFNAKLLYVNKLLQNKSL